MAVSFQPLGSNLLLELEPEAEQSSVIQVQKSLVDLVRYAKVLSVGPEVRDTSVGQRVIASVTAGTELGGMGMLIKESAILAHIRG
jgi:hypothetical protein